MGGSRPRPPLMGSRRAEVTPRPVMSQSPSNNPHPRLAPSPRVSAVTATRSSPSGTVCVPWGRETGPKRGRTGPVSPAWGARGQPFPPGRSQSGLLLRCQNLCRLKRTRGTPDWPSSRAGLWRCQARTPRREVWMAGGDSDGRGGGLSVLDVENMSLVQPSVATLVKRKVSEKGERLQYRESSQDNCR